MFVSDCQEVVRNTLRNGGWEQEETNVSKFLFTYGGTYDINVKCTDDGFDVSCYRIMIR